MPTTPVTLPGDVVDLVRQAHSITVFSGAGMSAESGVPTFRDAQTGLWERYDPAALATVDAWDNDPALVWGWYLWRMKLVGDAQPNPGHRAITALADHRTVMVVTQNVDDLHERAGSNVISHLHGSLFEPRCSGCSAPYHGTGTRLPDGFDITSYTEPPRIDPPSCRECQSPVRPGVVWFGEALPRGAWQRAEHAISGSDLVLVIGTSGIVYPAAELPERALAAGTPVIEFNIDESALSPYVTRSVRTSAAVGLPALLDALGE
ncbi:NAD-dependent deacylase [Gordonia sp. (in: high G+C Gram-positive bacteria)]|jgi:NAD-dependent deacetylase|uniref:NAD-dependent deacylase n=1 Tax=Gordonia sp. (in: high G+C Gram-positive bacteria) TaxID=84139 RepID=UPI001D1CDD68|nr:NAD-dependent deacylase [Gordonia sp. (in: high G+C Gram-positive bacteria)]MCB1296099.1 NAD-dependent deacylase [Gordonia sp. (in: high G+C Gram-positive bacteria)]HMS73808.1 NAD-dependent deacylase [Gordonia sp. (in: high G+C Gram-positive bacteria)]HQV19964.1 NAD-dependent deacylase [Gordonia sp. (in: high G+C Gram-positive bacteria)]